MRTEDFRAWLKARRWNGKPLTATGISSRLSKAKRFEGAMLALGLEHADLDAAFDADGMEQVTQALRRWCKVAAKEGRAPVELVGQSTSPSNRINNVAAAVRTYRQFRDAATGGVSDWTALEELRIAFLDRVPDFDRFTQIDNEYERVERTYKDAMIAQVLEVITSEDDHESAGRRIYRVLIPNQGPLLRWQTDDDFVRKFAHLAPAFYATIGKLARSRAPVADAIMDAADAFGDLRAAGATTLTVGQVAAIAITVAGVARPGDAAPFKMTKARELATLLTGDPIFRGPTLVRDQLEQWLELLRRIEGVMRDQWSWEPRDLVDVQGFAWAALDDDWRGEDEMDDEAVLARFESSELFRAMRGKWTPDEVAAFCVMARAANDVGLDWYFTKMPHEPVRLGRKPDRERRAKATIGYLNDRSTPRLWISDKGERPQIGQNDFVLTDPEAQQFCALLQQHAALIEGWEAPQPARPGRWPDEAGYDAAADETELSLEDPTMPATTNLILYGPPGTGKTYTTAERAVALCGEEIAGLDRAAVMERYRALEAQQRIRFVTFHQSYAYEDFVEGLRPTTGSEGEEASGGFRLKSQPGVFREIAALAEQASKAAQAGGAPFDIRDRQVFKMSLGRAGAEDHIFDAAIEGDYVVLGWGGEIDWTPYDSYEAVHARWNEDHPGTSGNDSNITQVYRFRCSMQVGDLVVISYGNTRFRAIGEIVGEYEYAPTEIRDYAHRRRVRWLYQPDDPMPVSFYAKPFTMRSCYMLREEHLNREALALLLPGSGGAPAVPKQFVLICDEINRGNISKVFGELITLLEPDKRLGAANEIKVRLPYSGDTFGVPANLHIIGTMNTADRSIALIDKALRRRFSFTEMMPLPDLPELVAAGAAAGVDLPAFLRALNDGIEYLLDREHQIGHAWLLGCTSRDSLDAAMRERIIPLIAEYFFEDWGKVADVLGGREDNPFLERITLRAPAGYGDEEPRYRWRVRDGFAEDAYARVIGA